MAFANLFAEHCGIVRSGIRGEPASLLVGRYRLTGLDHLIHLIDDCVLAYHLLWLVSMDGSVSATPLAVHTEPRVFSGPVPSEFAVAREAFPVELQMPVVRRRSRSTMVNPGMPGIIAMPSVAWCNPSSIRHGTPSDPHSKRSSHGCTQKRGRARRFVPNELAGHAPNFLRRSEPRSTLACRSRALGRQASLQ